jgi:hypothetical protein
MINYSIEPRENGCMLIVWEPAPITTKRGQPFIFKAKYIISSPLEAFRLVRLFHEGKAVAQIPKHRLKEYLNGMSL